MNKIFIALSGNPNTGKTCIFNALTGLNQHVGNWPGVTIERKEGLLLRDGQKTIEIVDLPGIYSLRANTEDEAIAANFIRMEKPALTVVVLDASRLERSLYLFMQIKELGQKTVVALNMCDAARNDGIRIDRQKLSEILGCPVIETIANHKVGIETLKDVIINEIDADEQKPLVISSLREGAIQAIEEIEKVLEDEKNLPFTKKITAIKLAERDNIALGIFNNNPKINEIVAIKNEEVEKQFGYDLQTMIIEQRWALISGICAEVSTRDLTIKERLSVSDRIDKVVTHRFLGLPLFFIIASLVFYLTYKLGSPIVEWMEKGIKVFSGAVECLLEHAGVSEIITSLIIKGIIGGAGAVVVFFPHIFFLFVLISILEESGYLSRGAFVMDRLMHYIGLHGKSFIPMIIGFGCGVPALMGARILDRTRDKMITMLTIPFISCSARLPVFVLFAGIFFPGREPAIIFSLYVIGIITAIIAAKIFSKTLFKGDISFLVMELPPYHVPTIRNSLVSGWRKASEFLKRATTFIMLTVIVIWALGNLPVGVKYASQDSIVGMIGKIIEPVFDPAGYGFWQAGVALLFGFLAKEVIIGTFATLMGVAENGLGASLANAFTPLSSYAFLIMVLLYVPCLASLYTFKREINSWKWMFFMAFYTICVGLLASVGVYQIGRLLGFE